MRWVGCGLVIDGGNGEINNNGHKSRSLWPVLGGGLHGTFQVPIPPLISFHSLSLSTKVVSLLYILLIYVYLHIHMLTYPTQSKLVHTHVHTHVHT